MGKVSHVPLNVQRLVCTIAVCSVAPLAFVSCSKADAQRAKVRGDDASPVTVAAVELVPLDRTLPVIGTLFAKDEATVAAQVEGQVEKTLVDFGDRVTEGQELARIDTTAYEAQAQVEGQVEKTLVDFGDRVTEGQELARIDTTAYEAQAQVEGQVEKTLVDFGDRVTEG